MPLLSEIVKNPVFPEDEFSVVAGKQLQMLEVNRQKVNFLARTHFNSILFGSEHPYGIYLEPDDIGKVNTTDLVDFHKSQYHSGNCTIIVAGLIKPGLINELEAHFGGDNWGGNNSDLFNINLPGQIRRIIFISKKEPCSQPSA